MRFLLLPTRFPCPETMEQGDIRVWMNWVHEETEVVMTQLEEELEARGDPDDPFIGSANGVFQPLQENLLLLLPVQALRRQENTSEHSDSSQKLLRNEQKTKITGMNTKQTGTKTQTQAVPCKFSKHLLESLDPMRSIRNLHIQQRQNRLHNEVLSQNGTMSKPNVSPHPLDNMKYHKVQQGSRVNAKSKEVLEEGKQRVNANLIKDNLTKTDHRRFHTFHQGNKLMFLTQRSLVCHICSYL